MPNGNGNGNGHVTVKLREKAEQILLNKYERHVKAVTQQHERLEEKVKKEVLIDLGIDKLFQKYKSLQEKGEELKDEIKSRSGSSYVSSSDLESGEIDGGKVDKEVEKRMKSDIDIDKELDRLENLRDQLLEDLWLAVQPDDVKKTLSKMQ